MEDNRQWIEINEILTEWIDEGLYQVILSNSRDVQVASKVKIRPVLLKGQLFFQQTIYQGTKVLHSNFEKDAMCEQILNWLQNTFKQGEIQSDKGAVTLLISKKGKATTKVTKKTPTGEKRLMEHNRVKNYILEEGTPVDFLVGLGVQTKDGKVVKAKYDKFRQINRYLEFIEDIIPKLPAGKTLRIIDFGCGKSYLTFAMYYYLHVIKQYPVQITGLDLKTDVIEHCNKLAKEYGYDKLTFERGDIASYEGADQVDMVVTLHACDTATDFAIEKAVKWGASVILVVPCCQHEVNAQIKCQPMEEILGYGLIKERMSALITDALRAQLLEANGYDTQILEFIDMEHTPKNLLIRAVKRSGMQSSAKVKQEAWRANRVSQLCDFFGIDPTLQKLIGENPKADKA
ncbi:MAG: SAM-dependent methyltransferase [Lachnospiraceae bacterium]|nr:SAM-dependent methyltransferase [Lachnospiraceae bacterium]